MTTHHSPESHVPGLEPFRQTFVGVMFAHTAFERRVSDLIDVVTGVHGFGEKQRWPANQRPKHMEKLISKHRPGLPEMAGIVACLTCSISFCHDRNLLAHGAWWKFDEAANSITIRSDRKSKGRVDDDDRHRRFTPAEIQATADSLSELEATLWQLQHAIETRDRSQPVMTEEQMKTFVEELQADQLMREGLIEVMQRRGDPDHFLDHLRDLNKLDQFSIDRARLNSRPQRR